MQSNCSCCMVDFRCLFKVPNLFQADEKQEIIEKMRQIDRQRDKSKQTDGAPNTLFNMFIGGFMRIYFLHISCFDVFQSYIV